jgi:hypothetical protein
MIEKDFSSGGRSFRELVIGHWSLIEFLKDCHWKLVSGRVVEFERTVIGENLEERSLVICHWGKFLERLLKEIGQLRKSYAGSWLGIFDYPIFFFSWPFQYRMKVDLSNPASLPPLSGCCW